MSRDIIDHMFELLSQTPFEIVIMQSDLETCSSPLYSYEEICELFGGEDQWHYFAYSHSDKIWASINSGFQSHSSRSYNSGSIGSEFTFINVQAVIEHVVCKLSDDTVKNVVSPTSFGNMSIFNDRFKERDITFRQSAQVFKRYKKPNRTGKASVIMMRELKNRAHDGCCLLLGNHLGLGKGSVVISGSKDHVRTNTIALVKSLGYTVDDILSAGVHQYWDNSVNREIARLKELNNPNVKPTLDDFMEWVEDANSIVIPSEDQPDNNEEDEEENS